MHRNCSFKLETDSNLLLMKARKALATYGHRMVIANLLQTRKTEVTAVTADSAEQLKLLPEEAAEGGEIEAKIVDELVKRHDMFIKL